MPSPEDISNQRERLQIHRRNLAHLLHQQAKCSSDYVPLMLINGILEQRANIARIKAILGSWGAPATDHPDDEPPTFS